MSVGKISLAKAVAMVRQELSEAIIEGEDADLVFPVGQVTMSFQVGLTAAGTASGGVDLWVVDVKAEGAIGRESIQTVTIVLEPPVDRDGRPVKIKGVDTSLPG